MTTIPKLPMPRMKKPTAYLTRQQVVKLCYDNNLGESSAQTLFFDRDCAARIVLPKRKYAVYRRAVVMDVLGLTDEES